MKEKWKFMKQTCIYQSNNFGIYNIIFASFINLN